VGDERTPLQREIAATIWPSPSGLLASSRSHRLAALPAVRSTQDADRSSRAVTLVPQGLAIM